VVGNAVISAMVLTAITLLSLVAWELVNKEDETCGGLCEAVETPVVVVTPVVTPIPTAAPTETPEPVVTPIPTAAPTETPEPVVTPIVHPTATPCVPYLEPRFLRLIANEAEGRLIDNGCDRRYAIPERVSCEGYPGAQCILWIDPEEGD